MAKILVIDDAKLVRNMMSMILSGAGHDILLAENGLSALDVLAVEEPDLVFCDMLMPEMDGLGFLRNLREKKNKIPVVILTANIQKTAREQCLELGAAEFLNKPPVPDEILALVDKFNLGMS